MEIQDSRPARNAQPDSKRSELSPSHAFLLPKANIVFGTRPGTAGGEVFLAHEVLNS